MCGCSPRGSEGGRRAAGIRRGGGRRGGIEQSNGVADGEGLGRRRRRPALEVALLELAVYGARPDLEEIVAQETDGVGAREPRRRVGERPLEERGAEGNGEGIELPGGAEPTAFREGVE